MTRAIICLTAMLMLTGCEEPFIVFAGGALSGEVIETPTDWSVLNAIDTVQLETQPADPYSINIWIAAVGADLYVATGEDGQRWTDYLNADGNVRVRANQDLYELEAHMVTNAAERDRVAKAYVDKYDLADGDNWVMEGMIFRLDHRQ